MSFFFDGDAQSIVDALAQGDFDGASLLLGDQQAGLEDFLASQMFVTVTGTSDGAGAVTIAHGIDLSVGSVLLAGGFYDNAGVSAPVTITGVDATNVTATGAGVTKAVRITLVVSTGFISF